jgi:tRNA (guanine-N7-)-methyltransferase
MRLRHIKGAEEQIAESPYVIQDPQGLKGKWHEFFGNQNPIRIEVGMGKGKFIMELAEKNPDVNYIGIERYSSVLLRGLQKRSQLELSNIYFMRIDALELADVFDAGEVDRIYLNFSDPWPKARHARRRLTSPDFFARYDKVLVQDGQVEFKTDNRDLFDFSVESVEESNLWHIDELTYDLHNSEFLPGNIMTEYESRFVAEGKPICRFKISR